MLRSYLDWARYPFLRYSIFYSLGVLLQHPMGFDDRFLIYVVVLFLSVFVVFLLLNQTHKRASAIFITVLWLSLGYISSSTHGLKWQGNQLSGGRMIQGTLGVESTSTKSGAEYLLKEAWIWNAELREWWHSPHAHILKMPIPISGYKPGKHVLVGVTSHTVDFQPYKEHLLRKGVVAAWMGNTSVVIDSARSVLQGVYILYKWKQYIRETFTDLRISNSNRALAWALIFGDKSSLTNSQKTVFANAGIMHIMAVSGLHLSLVFLGIKRLFFFRKHDNSGIISVIPLLCAWLYAVFTGLGESIFRAVLMLTFWQINHFRTQKSDIFHVLSVSAWVLLLLNPYSLYSVGFQLSFAAVFGIVWLGPKITYSGKNKVLGWVWNLWAISLSATLFTFPITSFHFGTFPLYFLMANLLVLPALPLILLGGFLSLITGTWQNNPLVICWDVLLSYMWGVSEWVASWPYASVPISFNIIQVLAYYGLIGLIFLWLKTRNLLYLWSGAGLLLIIIYSGKSMG